MSATTPVPFPSRETTAAAVMRRCVMVLLLFAIGAALVVDRFLLCRAFFWKYTDVDQSLLWQAARDALQGRFHEPCFWGQSYNSCVESFLACPLVALHVPYHVAVPIVTIVLGLLPFVLLAIVAWRRNRPMVSALALLMPLVFSDGYAMVTGMPRGFVTGIAVAIFPALLCLPPRDESFGSLSRRHLIRYALIAFLSLVAVALNPNCVLLLAPAGVYLIAGHFRELRFWVGSVIGFLAAAPYPAAIYWFYHIAHKDYVFYLRTKEFAWSFKNFFNFFHRFPMTFGDLVPIGIPAVIATFFIATCFAVLTVKLYRRRQTAAAMGALSGIILTMISFAYDRVDGVRGILLPISRMYLAVPVAFLWLMLLLPRRARGRWMSRPALTFVVVSLIVFAMLFYKLSVRSDDIAVISEMQGPVTLLAVDEARGIAAAVQAASDKHGATLVLFEDNGHPSLDYLLPLLTHCETLNPRRERRTWRLYEESFPRYARILTIDREVFEKAHAKHYPEAAVISLDPPLYVFGTRGWSVIRICQDLQLPIRQFDVPSRSDAVPFTSRE